MSDKKENETLTELFIEYKLNHIIDFSVSIDSLIAFADTICGANVFKKEEYAQIVLYVLHNNDKYTMRLSLPIFGKHGPSIIDIIPKSIIESISHYISTVYGPKYYDAILIDMPDNHKSNFINKCLKIDNTEFVTKFIEIGMKVLTIIPFCKHIEKVCSIVNYRLLREHVKKSADYEYVWYLHILLNILRSKNIQYKKTIVKMLIMILTQHTWSIGGENVSIIIERLLSVGWFDLVLYFRQKYDNPMDKRILLELPKHYPQKYLSVCLFIDEYVDNELFMYFMEKFTDSWDNIKIFKAFRSFAPKEILQIDIDDPKSFYLKVSDDVLDKQIRIQDLPYDFSQNEILYVLHRRDKIKLTGYVDNKYILLYKLLSRVLSIFMGRGMMKSILYHV